MHLLHMIDPKAFSCVSCWLWSPFLVSREWLNVCQRTPEIEQASACRCGLRGLQHLSPSCREGRWAQEPTLGAMASTLPVQGALRLWGLEQVSHWAYKGFLLHGVTRGLSTSVPHLSRSGVTFLLVQTTVTKTTKKHY